MAKSSGGTRSGSSGNSSGIGNANKIGYGFTTAQDVRRAGDYWELQEPVEKAIEELKSMWDEASEEPNYSMADVDRVYDKGQTALSMFTQWGYTAASSLNEEERREALNDIQARERDLMEQLDEWRSEAQRKSNGRY